MNTSPAYAPLSVEDYLQGEQQSEVRHEYLAGQVVAMAGASDRHGLIAMAIAVALHPRARQRGCQLFMADMKVRIDEKGETYFYYPDLVLCCDPDDRESPFYRRRPCLLVEITSPATLRIDRREKLFIYRTIPSLKQYLIVDQDVRRVDSYRYPHGEHEVYTAGTLYLDCLDVDISLDAIYADVEV